MIEILNNETVHNAINNNGTVVVYGTTLNAGARLKTKELLVDAQKVGITLPLVQLQRGERIRAQFKLNGRPDYVIKEVMVYEMADNSTAFTFRDWDRQFKIGKIIELKFKSGHAQRALYKDFNYKLNHGELISCEFELINPMHVQHSVREAADEGALHHFDLNQVESFRTISEFRY